VNDPLRAFEVIGRSHSNHFVRAANLLLPMALVGGVLSVAWFAAAQSITPYAALQFGGIGLVAGASWLPTHGKGPNGPR